MGYLKKCGVNQVNRQLPVISYVQFNNGIDIIILFLQWCIFLFGNNTKINFSLLSAKLFDLVEIPFVTALIITLQLALLLYNTYLYCTSA